jgi:hypothetical protein
VFDKKTGKELEVHEYGRYKFMAFDDPENTTDICFYDPDWLKQKIQDCESDEARTQYISRLESDPEFAKYQSRKTVYITDVGFTKIEKGMIVYEEQDYIIKCSPTARSHQYLAF